MTEPERSRTGSSYLVLAKTNGTDPEQWQTIATVKAVNARAAIRALANEGIEIDVDRSYVAIPARSWKPVQVSAETKTVLKLS